MSPGTRITVAEDHRICIYAECKSGTTSSSCDDNFVEDIAPLGLEGCCNSESVGLNLDCSGIDDSATVWLRIENPDNLEFVPYQLMYHF